MSTSHATVTALQDALAPAGPMTVKAMFGEYALYMEGRVVALICDDTLFIKPVPGALAAMPGAEMAPPYPGAKPHIAARDALDDPEPVIAALRAAAREVPLPKPKKRKGS
jgi:TfoX/Sxy family transcriptional regulator of competence genes